MILTVLFRARQVRCHQPTAGLEIMENMSLHMEAAYEHLFRYLKINAHETQKKTFAFLQDANLPWALQTIFIKLSDGEDCGDFQMDPIRMSSDNGWNFALQAVEGLRRTLRPAVVVQKSTSRIQQRSSSRRPKKSHRRINKSVSRRRKTHRILLERCSAVS